MKNRFFIVLFVLFFIFMTGTVKAESIIDNNVNSAVLLSRDDCEGLLGDELTEWLQKTFRFMEFLAPSLVIVLSIVEFFKAMISDDKEALQKAAKKTGVRLILAVILFFIPVLINFFFELFGWYGTCGIK